jgi:DNA-directed RNA polymerase specialized sigma24 family protein
MPDRETLALLTEALDFFNDQPNFGLRRDRRRTSYELAARIDTHLARLAASPHPAIAEARERWASTSFLRVDPEERIVEQTSDGYWVGGWILIGRASVGEVEPDLRIRFNAVVAGLPETTRKAFLAHRLEALDYGLIAERLGIGVTEVQRHLADALVAISRALEAN